MHECSRCYGCMTKVTSDIHHANPIVISVSSATGRAYTMLNTCIPNGVLLQRAGLYGSPICF